MTPEHFYQWLARLEREQRLASMSERDARRAEWTAPCRGPYARDVDEFCRSLQTEWRKR